MEVARTTWNRSSKTICQSEYYSAGGSGKAGGAFGNAREDGVLWEEDNESSVEAVRPFGERGGTESSGWRIASCSGIMCCKGRK
jgi:hypothetical protein